MCICVCVHMCMCKRETEKSGARGERRGETKEADIEVIVCIPIPLHIPVWFGNGVRHSLLLPLGWFQSPSTEIISGNPHTIQSGSDISLSKVIGSQISLNEFRPIVYEDLNQNVPYSSGRASRSYCSFSFGLCAMKTGYLTVLQPSCQYKARLPSVEINTMESRTQKRKKKVTLILLLSHCSTEVLRLSSYVSN